ncbi:galactosyldiacylglycerol synthase [bacterium]|nr:galactosyldiacylglycerol synthase [bacterium]
MPASTQASPSILVLTTSVGNSHMRAAQALCAAAERWFPGVRCELFDLISLAGPFFKFAYADSYVTVTSRFPSFWSFLYRGTDRRSGSTAAMRLRALYERWELRKLPAVISAAAPDAIICTHFMAAEILAHYVRRGTLSIPVFVQVTDYDCHGLWIQPELAGFFVASDEVKARMIEKGVPAAKIRVTGIPVMPAFSDDLPRDACAAELGIAPSRTTVFLMAGGAGVSPLDAVCERIIALGRGAQLIAVAGRNTQLHERLGKLARETNGLVVPVGFSTTIERLMSAADFAVTKPGGLSVTECLARHLPMVFYDAIPGQEERNAEYMLEQGAALKASDMGGLLYRVDSLLANPGRVEAMRADAARLARPFAARDVLDAVLGHGAAG